MKNTNLNIADSLFQTSQGNRMILSAIFLYQKTIFKNYQIKKTNYGLFAVGTNPILVKEPEIYDESNAPILTVDNITREVECSDADLLFSLLNLIDKIGDIPCGTETDIENSVLNKQIDLALEWCKKHGIPFESSDLWNKEKTIGFRIGTFFEYLRELRNIFYTFQKVKGIANESNPFNMKNKNDSIESLNSYFSQIKLQCQISYTNELKYFLKAETLFKAAQYQLALLAASPENCNIKKCSCCGEWFFPKRKNNNYCPLCSPQKAYKRRLNKEKSGKNGNDSETR